MHIGSTISHYKIVEKLGEGGMGVVYKAQDTTLDRAVALKFLADHLLNDTEAKERFLREAKAAAALHHPNVCPVHEIAEADGKTFLAMAFLKGETLEDRIAKGPLPIKDALDIARQVADGLQAAHAEGIVHRDIKPANILVSPEGRPTIMDFGLARLTEASRLTKVDTAMGTVAYMSPEQAQGMEVDSRSDIWALGCVLYEMVSGQRPFKGVYDQALLYEIVHEEVAPLTSIRAGVPMDLEFIAGKCLAKDREDRYGSAQETSKDLRTLAEKLKSGHSTILRTSQTTGAMAATMTGAHTLNPVAALPPGSVIVQRKSQRALQAVAAVATLLLAGLAFVHFNQAPPERNVARFSLTPEDAFTARISPDGKHILYAAQADGQTSLWLRSLDDEAVRELPGTQGARPGTIFWSPDSAWIGFGTFGQLKRISLDGGTPITLCDLPLGPAPLHGTWSPDGARIVFSAGLVLYEVAAQGGEPRVILDTSREDHSTSLFPQFLPTGAGPPALVYTAANSPGSGWIAVLNLETGERRELGLGRQAVYSPPGYLIYEPTNDPAQGLWAWPFSLATLEVTGDPVPLGAAGSDASVSQDGTLVFIDRTAGSSLSKLSWRSRTGELLDAVGQPQPRMFQVVLSPDGQRAAVASQGADSHADDVWVHDLNRSTTTRLTFEEKTEASPVWSPTGREIIYRVTGGSDNRLMRRMADGTGQPTTLVESEQQLHGPDWSRDGRYLVYFKYAENASSRQSDILYVELGEDGTVGEPVASLSSAANERQPHLSPDGRFLAYTSNESGRDEIYIQPFPNGAGKWAVSTNGGMAPIWRSDGKELYYVEGRALMAVSVSTESGLTLGRPERLFESAGLGAPGSYDVSADGQRFMTIEPVEDDAPARTSIRIVQNWYEEFRNRER